MKTSQQLFKSPFPLTLLVLHSSFLIFAICSNSRVDNKHLFAVSAEMLVPKWLDCRSWNLSKTLLNCVSFFHGVNSVVDVQFDTVLSTSKLVNLSIHLTTEITCIFHS